MDEPMYRQIAKKLRERIESGEIPPGDQLPTELELRDRYNASRNTVRDAIKWLIADGVVAAKPGQGMFAVQRDQPVLTTLSVSAETGLSSVEGEAAFTEMRRRGRCPSASVPRVEVRPASPEMAARLRVPERSEVVTRRQERYIDRKPWSVQTTAYPMELVTRGADDLLVAKDIAGGTVAYLERALGLTQTGHRDTVEVRPPSEEETRFFKIADDASVRVVAVVIRTGYHDGDTGPVPFRATSTVFPADRVQFVIDSGDVPPDGMPPIDSEPSQDSVPPSDLQVPDASQVSV